VLSLKISKPSQVSGKVTVKQRRRGLKSWEQEVEIFRQQNQYQKLSKTLNTLNSDIACVEK